MDNTQTIAQLLLECENTGAAPPYVCDESGGDTLINIDAGGREVVVVSDLHMAAGLDASLRYHGTENFFSDEAFERFLTCKNREVSSRGGILVINGDFIDFIRVDEVPRGDNAMKVWSDRLKPLGITKSPAELAKAVNNKREKKYGLKTHDYRSVWRFYKVLHGHKPMFRAVAHWLADNGGTQNQLIVSKGNHDLEWYWLAVRNALRLELAQLIVERDGGDVVQVMRNTVLPNVRFVDDAMTIDSDTYITHGHRFDRFTLVLGSPAVDFSKTGEREINLPFGSLFNRYLLNRLELSYPYIDNVRPRRALLPMLIKERFPLAIKLMFVHGTLLIQVLKKNWRYVKFMFGPMLQILITFGIPVIALLWIVIKKWSLIQTLWTNDNVSATSFVGQVGAALVGQLEGLLGLVLSYVASKITATFQLSEPSDLDKNAREIINSGQYRIVTMGHTHNPDQFTYNGCWYYNTATWIPIVEASSAEVRHDKTYCFLHLRRAPSSNQLMPSRLEIWNDDAGRGEPWPIVVDK